MDVCSFGHICSLCSQIKERYASGSLRLRSAALQINKLVLNIEFRRNAPRGPTGRSFSLRWRRRRSARHYRINALNSSKRYRASCGPGDASGWYCTENIGYLRCRNPSRVLSFKLTWVISTSFSRSDSVSTANPWFWEVISTLPDRKFLTG